MQLISSIEGERAKVNKRYSTGLRERGGGR